MECVCGIQNCLQSDFKVLGHYQTNVNRAYVNKYCRSVYRGCNKKRGWYKVLHVPFLRSIRQDAVWNLHVQDVVYVDGFPYNFQVGCTMDEKTQVRGSLKDQMHIFMTQNIYKCHHCYFFCCKYQFFNFFYSNRVRLT